MRTIEPKVVYASQYNIGFFGLEKMHPFDSRKYGRAWKVLKRQCGEGLNRHWARPHAPAGRAELLSVHSPEYLDRLCDAGFIASVLELPPLRRAPGWLADRAVLRPMRWAAAGTVLAAREAVRGGLAMNLGGGFHHASPDYGHGFSAYADVGLAIRVLRNAGTLSEKDRVVYVDLDAHQGNGVCRTFFDDPRVFIFDAYNCDIFPHDLKAQRRIDCDVPLPHGCGEAEYLDAVTGKLPRFLDGVSRAGRVGLAVYNAGTDPFIGDQLGGMRVSADGMFRRDQFVINELVRRGTPTAILTSGGYSAASYAMIARTAAHVLGHS